MEKTIEQLKKDMEDAQAKLMEAQREVIAKERERREEIEKAKRLEREKVLQEEFKVHARKIVEELMALGYDEAMFSFKEGSLGDMFPRIWPYGLDGKQFSSPIYFDYHYGSTGGRTFQVTVSLNYNHTQSYRLNKDKVYNYKGIAAKFKDFETTVNAEKNAMQTKAEIIRTNEEIRKRLLEKHGLPDSSYYGIVRGYEHSAGKVKIVFDRVMTEEEADKVITLLLEAGIKLS